MSRVEKILKGIIEHGRPAGAYLFVGPSSANKKQAATELADALGVKKQDRFTIAKDGQSIKIEQIRELQSWVRYGPAVSQYLVAVVLDSDVLTDQAAAAFLKTLEEPAAGVIFILLSEREDGLLATIVSRCQRIFFPEEAGELEADPKLPALAQELQLVRQGSLADQLQFSIKLGQEKEQIEALLYGLARWLFYKLSEVQSTRVILETVRQIKRKVNLKLALDVMCLKLGAQYVR